MPTEMPAKGLAEARGTQYFMKIFPLCNHLCYPNIGSYNISLEQLFCDSNDGSLEDYCNTNNELY